MNQEKTLPGSKRRWMRLAAIKDLRRLLGGRRRSKSRDDAILPGDVEPCLGLEVVHWVVLEDGDAHLKRQHDGIGELFANANIKRNERLARLPDNRVSEIHANVGTWKECNKPTVRQTNIERGCKLKVADVPLGGIADHADVVAKQRLKVA